MARDLHDNRIKDDEYVRKVRRFKPSSLVPLIARIGSSYWQNQSWLRSPYKKFTPWALADIARVSLIMGNEHRDVEPSERDLLACADAYSRLADPELGTQPDTVDGFLIRIAFEQLVYQQSIQHELGRSAALFIHTGGVHNPQVLRPGWELDLFGCSLSQFVGAGFVAHTIAVMNGGKFSPEKLDDPGSAEITDKLPVETVRNVLARDFVGHYEGDFQYLNEQTSPFRRFTPNLLAALPLVSGIGSELLLPVPGLMVRKISPIGIWYMGWDRWGQPFADDVGDLFEQYVGRLLHLIPDVNVYAEVKYGKGDQRTVDWFVVGKHAVILVEVKSARPTNAIREGTLTAWAELATKLAKAYAQLGTTDELIAGGDSAVSFIPANLPRIGLIVTMEPFAFANAEPIRRRYGVDKPAIPTSVCSSHQLEWIVRLTDRDVDSFILQFLSDPAKSGWEITSDLVGVDMDRNAVISQGWDHYEWGRPPGQETTFEQTLD